MLPMASGALQSTAMAGFSSLTFMLSFIVRPKSATLALRRHNVKYVTRDTSHYLRWASSSTFLAARSLWTSCRLSR